MSNTTENLAAAHADVKAEIARTDNKIALLLALATGLLALAWTVGGKISFSSGFGIAAAIVGGIGTGLALWAISALLSGVRPNLKGNHGFTLWATLTPEQVTEHAAARDLSADVAGLSRLAVAKYCAIQRAVDLLRVGGALLILAALLALGSA
ncbi:Pycsar system effector family protein [Streptomyces sp. NPDC094437]|uniref:Pycsar system effector family protein n=1 Tax=Streptomyces sp. NPDC094437 TaxID=3366060 RepID=UPI00382BF37F